MQPPSDTSEGGYYGMPDKRVFNFCVELVPFDNEILAEARMKSADADEIQANGLDEIKSVHISRRKADFITK